MTRMVHLPLVCAVEDSCMCLLLRQLENDAQYGKLHLLLKIFLTGASGCVTKGVR